MAINYSSPGVPGGEVSPGAGSTGFSSAGVAYANSSGQLAATTQVIVLNPGQSSASFHIRSTNSGTQTSTNAGTFSVGAPGGLYLAFDESRIQAKTSGGSNVATLVLQSGGGPLHFGSSNTTARFQLNSTVNLSTQVGGAGAAAALPATPEVYLKVQVPNSAHTMTTLYLPCYLSTA